MTFPSRVKASKYNYFLQVSGEKVVGYNFLFRSLLVMSPTEYDQVKKFLEDSKNNPREFNQIDNSLLATLVDYNFLVHEGFDELAFFKFNYFRSVFNSSTLILLLLPTLDCNLRCPYCFEFKKEVTMTEEVFSSMLSWARPKLGNKKHFHITWFGGEPLICFNKIEEFTRRFMELAEEYDCDYSASMLTNGVLLTADLIEKLAVLKILNVQVTFDGPKQYHDKSRITPAGEGSYDVIMANAKLYCELSKSHLPLGIRVNVTDENFDSITELLNDFSPEIKKRSRIFFRWVWSNEASSYVNFSSQATCTQAYPKLSELYRLAADAGLNIDNPIDHRGFNYCEVDFMEHFTIDPLGNLYLCAHSFKPEEALGNVAEEFSPESVSHYCKWITTNPFDDEVCLQCQLLPLCRGGCRKSRFYGKRKCIEERFALDLYIRRLFQKHLGKQSGK